MDIRYHQRNKYTYKLLLSELEYNWLKIPATSQRISVSWVMYHRAQPGLTDVSPSPALYSSSGPDITGPHWYQPGDHTRPRHAAFLAEKYIYRNSREILSGVQGVFLSSNWKCLWFEKRPTVPLRCKLWVNWNCSAMSAFGLTSCSMLMLEMLDHTGPHKLTRTIISSWRDVEVQHSSIKVTLMSRLAGWLMTDQDWRIHFAVISRVQRLSISGGLIFN